MSETFRNVWLFWTVIALAASLAPLVLPLSPKWRSRCPAVALVAWLCALLFIIARMIITGVPFGQ